jgi:S1-C subfamily serine protease
MRNKTLLFLCLFLAVIATGAAAFASKLILKDGTELDGTVIRNGDGYWIRTADGNTQTIPDSDIASVQNDGDASNPPAPAPDADPATAAFQTARRRAANVDSPLAAVEIWQQFLGKFPDSPDLNAAHQELDHWKQLADSSAEKVNGVWVGGNDLKKITADADALTKQAIDMLEQNQTLAALDKLQRSLHIYPNSFLTNYVLGNVSMFQKNYDEAAQYYLVATRLQPDSCEAANNLAVANYFNKRFEVAIDGFVTAVKIQDNKTVVQNLVTAIALAPTDFRTLPRMKTTLDDASLLAHKYDITSPSDRFLLMPPPMTATPPGDSASSYGDWSGTGFFITDDGLILTNRHVVKGSKSLQVVLPGGAHKAAQVVAVDDAFDLALIRVKLDDKVPFVSLSPTDSPNEGADCTVMGFPMIDELGSDLKITRGIVSSAAQQVGNGADILTDAKVNPGNSGGPIIDRFGNAMAIVCMKRVTEGEFDSYGIGISAGHIRIFLDKHKIKVAPGDISHPALSTEDLVAKTKPATVCILATAK